MDNQKGIEVSMNNTCPMATDGKHWLVTDWESAFSFNLVERCRLCGEIDNG